MVGQVRFGGDAVDETIERIQPVANRLTSFTKLGEDWDSYGAEPPTVDAVLRALMLVQEVVRRHWSSLGEGAIPWAVAPTSGGVQLEWRSGESAVEVDIDADGNFGWIVERAEDGSMTTEEVDHASISQARQTVSQFLGA